jgi:hypothetical protein
MGRFVKGSVVVILFPDLAGNKLLPSPYLDGAIPRPGDNSAPAGAVRHKTYPVGMPFEGLQFTPDLAFPLHGGSLLTACCACRFCAAKRRKNHATIYGLLVRVFVIPDAVSAGAFYESILACFGISGHTDSFEGLAVDKRLSPDGGNAVRDVNARKV